MHATVPSALDPGHALFAPSGRYDLCSRDAGFPAAGDPARTEAGADAGPDAGAAAAGMLRRSDALLALESTQDDGLRLRKRCRKVREQAPGTAPVQRSPRSRLLWMFSLLHMKTGFKPVSQHLDSAVQTSGDGRTGNTEESCGLGRGAVLKVPQPTDFPVHLGQRFDHPEQQADQFLPLRQGFWVLSRIRQIFAGRTGRSLAFPLTLAPEILRAVRDDGPNPSASWIPAVIFADMP